MPGVIVLGGQWGDEGKGKIIDYLSRRADLIVRYQGGDNAGHTVVVDGKQYVFHLIPSGIVWPDKQCLIGHGVVVNPFSLMEEKRITEAAGCQVEGRLWVSDRAHVIMPYHKRMDSFWERHLGDKKIGTTGKGVGPAYTDKVARWGVRVGDLVYSDVLAAKVRENVKIKNKELALFADEEPMDADRILEDLKPCIREIKPLITDGVTLLHAAMSQGRSILWEGAQGTLLDVDLGTYPFVTSSSAGVGGALTGTGVGPRAIDNVIAVVKAYATRVGEGPFPTQCSEADDQIIREKGHEYGATTGRPRRCGWFDAVAARYAAMVNDVDQLVVTKMDVLDEHETIKVCVGYRQDGATLTSFPSNPRSLETCEPIYEECEGWRENTAGIQTYDRLPEKAQAYLAKIERLVGAPIGLVSTGPHRESIIERKNPFSRRSGRITQ